MKEKTFLGRAQLSKLNNLSNSELLICDVYNVFFFFFFFLIGLEKDEDYQTEVQISGCCKILSGTSPSQPFLVEHCCLMTPGNEWGMEVKCRPILQGAQGVSNQRNNWRSLMVVYPEAEVKLKHNDIEVTLPSLQEDVEIAAFGRPGKDDKKRMQMAIFAKRPKQGRDWKIWVHLVDDTNPACKV